MGLQMLAARQISLSRGLVVGTGAALGSLALSIAVDSKFWGRWLWPEGEVLWFNGVENRWNSLPAYKSPELGSASL